MTTDMLKDPIAFFNQAASQPLAMGLSGLRFWNVCLDRVEDLSKSWLESSHQMRHDVLASLEAGLGTITTKA